MGGDVGWRLPIAAEGRLPISLGKAKHDHLVPCAALGGDAVWLLEHVPEEVTMSALSRALRTALGAAHLRYPEELGCEPGAHRADPTAIAGLGMRISMGRWCQTYHGWHHERPRSAGPDLN
jgi:hypothetical protein